MKKKYSTPETTLIEICDVIALSTFTVDDGMKVDIGGFTEKY